MNDQDEIEETETEETETEETEEETEGTPNEEEEEGETEEETEEAEEEEETEDEETEDENLGGRAKKRISKLIAQRKEATAKYEAAMKELETAKRMTGDDGKAILRAAESSGILPGLMTREEAGAFEDLEMIPKVIDRYQDWLDEHEKGDELETGDGKTMSYVEVKRRVRKLQSDLEDLNADYGERRKELKAKVKEIFTLGEAALKAGWKPGKKTTEKTKKFEQRPGKKSPKPKADSERAGNFEDMDVNNEDDLEAYIIKSRRKER